MVKPLDTQDVSLLSCNSNNKELEKIVFMCRNNTNAKFDKACLFTPVFRDGETG